MGKEFPDPGQRQRRKYPISTGTILASSRAGHTLAELAVALAVVAVLVGMGWGMFRTRITSYRMFHVARMMHSDLTTARALALDTNREVRIHFVEADLALDPSDAQHGAWDIQVGNRGSGSTEWDTLPLDEDGVVDVSQGERSLEEGGSNEADDISLADWGSLDDDAVVFTPRGWLGNRNADFVDGFVAVEIVNKRALAEGLNERVRLTVARSGFVRMEPILE